MLFPVSILNWQICSRPSLSWNAVVAAYSWTAQASWLARPVQLARGTVARAEQTEQSNDVVVVYLYHQRDTMAANVPRIMLLVTSKDWAISARSTVASNCNYGAMHAG